MKEPFNKTVTLYNKYINKSVTPNAIKWLRTVLTGVSLQYAAKEVMSGNTRVLANANILRVPYTRRYRPPTDEANVGFYGLPNDIMPLYFTLSVDDIIVKGEVFDDISDASGNVLRNKYKDRSFTVKAVSDNSFVVYLPIVFKGKDDIQDKTTEPTMSTAHYYASDV